VVTEQLSIPTVWATVHPDNARSIRLLERLGFQEVEVAAAPSLGSYDPEDLVYSRSL
jgi:RimJ/RimL family protein N-acetyltransferase